MKPDVQHIAITHPDGMAVMEFVTRQKRRTGVDWEREATDDAIDVAVSKSRFAGCTWRRISEQQANALRAGEPMPADPPPVEDKYEVIERAINELPEMYDEQEEYQPSDDYTEPDNDPIEVFDPDDAVPVETAGDWRQAISNMEPEPIPDRAQFAPVEPREVIKARVKQAADAAVSNSMNDQIRWEMAVRARNGDAYAIEQFTPEANERGMKVNWLVDEIIASRKAQEKKVMRIYQIHARVQAALDIADDVMLADLARDGIAEINKGAGDAGANGTGA